MNKKSFDKILKKAIRELVEEIRPENIPEDEVSEGTKEKIETEIWERKQT